MRRRRCVPGELVSRALGPAASGGKSIVVTVQVSHRGPWTLSWHSNKIGYLQPDDRPISVQAAMPSFGTGNRGSAAPSSAA